MRAVLDACVLYPTIMREVLLSVAAEGLFTPLWSDRICEEWARVGAKRDAVEEMHIRAEIARLNALHPSARITYGPEIEPMLWLPDPADIHVLAAAVAGEADQIMTTNLRDFPRRELEAHHIRAIHPDALLRELWQSEKTAVERAVGRVLDEARRLSGQNVDGRKLLKRAGLPRLGKAVA